MRDEALDKVSGIDGCVFVHAAGFIGGQSRFCSAGFAISLTTVRNLLTTSAGNHTKKGAMEMAVKALDI